MARVARSMADGAAGALADMGPPFTTEAIIRAWVPNRPPNCWGRPRAAWTLNGRDRRDRANMMADFSDVTGLWQLVLMLFVCCLLSRRVVGQSVQQRLS